MMNECNESSPLHFVHGFIRFIRFRYISIRVTKLLILPYKYGKELPPFNNCIKQETWMVVGVVINIPLIIHNIKYKVERGIEQRIEQRCEQL